MKNSNGQLDILKRNSRAKVVLAVREHGPVSRVQLAKITGLSLACVGRMVNELIKDGELTEVGTAPTTRGRPMVMVDINTDGSPIAGVWIGPESIEVAAASSKAQILARRQILYDWETNRSDLAVNAITQGIRRCVEAIGKDVADLKGVGISVAGYADPLVGVIEYIMHRQG